MKKICILFLIVSPIISFSQKVKEVKDKLSGETSCYITNQKLYSKPSFTGTVGEQLHFNLVKQPKTNVIVFEVQTGKQSLFIAEDGNKAFIKYEDGSIDTLVNKRTSFSDNAISKGSVGKYFCILADSVIDNFKQKSVSFIRIEYSKGVFDYDIKDKFSNAIKDASLLLWTSK